jgi:hypothetical protein
VPYLPVGTIFCEPPYLSQYRLPTGSLALPIPDDCILVELRVCVGAASFEPGGAFFLTNALDVSIGNLQAAFRAGRRAARRC